MKKIKKFALILLALFVLVSCGEKPVEALTKEEADNILAKTQKVIRQIQDEGFDKVKNQMSKEMQEAITEEVSKKALADIKEKGDFSKFGSGAAVRDKEKGYIISQQEVHYEKGSLLFTVNYDESGKIIGFFYK